MWTNQARRMADRKAQFRAIASHEADPEPRPSANSLEAWTVFRSTYPDVADWIFKNSTGNPFAMSLYNQATSRGHLSLKQIDAVRANIARGSAGNVAVRHSGGFDVSKLFVVLQKHSKFYAGRLVITRKNGDTLCWVLWDETCVGKLENGQATLFVKRAGQDLPEIRALLEEFEEAPLQAAMKYGKLSGVCCSCGREITADDSLELGIGPICAQRFA
jgi:hypothetical protein